MDEKDLLIFGVLGLALFALSTKEKPSPGPSEPGPSEPGPSEPEPTTTSVKLSIQGSGRARLLADDDPFSWTSEGYTKNVPVGSEITVEFDPDAGWEFARYTGTQPPFTV